MSKTDNNTGQAILKVGRSIPFSIAAIIQTNGMLMLSLDAGARRRTNGYLFVRCGKYSITIRTDFSTGKIGNVRGTLFSVGIRKKRSRSAFAASMVIQSGPRQIDVVESSDGDKAPPLGAVWRRGAS